MEKYLKYYWLENYLFAEVSSNFKNNKELNAEEFFAVIIWKRVASKTKIKDALIKSGQTVEGITGDICKNEGNREKQLDLLLDVDHIGISIASAILTVCYPDDFTIVDIRACRALERHPFNNTDFKYEKFISKDKASRTLYFNYVDKCKELAKTEGFCLRDFDRILFAKDLCDEEKTGLSALVGKYNRKELEPSKPKKNT